MKKVLGSMSKFIFGGFAVAVLALLMSLTYGALQKLFPGNFANQMWGLVMFDIAAMCWAVAFVFQSKSTGQYAAAGIGFVVAFLGTLGMVAAEVMLSGQNLAEVDTSQIGQWMVYGFITVTAVHAFLIYAHHALAPDIHEQINVGVARGEIVTEAISLATKTLETEKRELAQTIHNDIVSQAKRELGLYPVSGTPFEPKQNEQKFPYSLEPVQQEEKPKSFFSDLLGRFRKNEQVIPQVLEERQMQELAQTSDALIAWEVTPTSRKRLWCKQCRDEGQPWLTAEACEHVKLATNEQDLPLELAMSTLRQFAQEDGQKAEPHYHPVPMEPRKQNPE